MARANLKQIIFGWLANALQILASRFAGVSSSGDAVNEDRPAIEEDVRAQWLQRYRPGQPPEDWLQRFGSFERDSIVARVQNRAIASGSRSQDKLEHVFSLHASQDREGQVSEVRPFHPRPSRQGLSNREPAIGAEVGSSPNKESGPSKIPDNLTDLRSLPQDKTTVQGGGERTPPKREISALAANELAKASEVKRGARAVAPLKRMVSESLPDESSSYELLTNESSTGESLTNESGTKNSGEMKAPSSMPRGLEGNSLEGNFDDQARASVSSAGEQTQMSSRTNVDPYRTEARLGHPTDGAFQLPDGNVDHPTTRTAHSESSVPPGRQFEWSRWEEQRMGPRLEEQGSEEQRLEEQQFNGQQSEGQAVENASIPPSVRRLHPRQADAIRDGAWKSGSPLWTVPDTLEQREESLDPSLGPNDFFPRFRRHSHAGVSDLPSSSFIHNNGRDEELATFQSPHGADNGSHRAGASLECAEDPWPKLPEVSEEDRQEPGEVLKTYKRQLRLAHEQRGIV